MRFFLILAALAAGASAHAADTNGRFYILGAGSVSCKQYTDATDQQKLFAHTWMAGYVSALNRTTADTWHIVGETTPQAMYGLIAKYCTDKPETALGIATQQVIESLQPQRTRKSPN